MGKTEGRSVQMRGFITAVRTLTIIPVPGRDSEKFSFSLPWFPFVGLILGFMLYATGEIWIKIFDLDWPGGGAIILLTVEILLTRGLHLDGLADWADAIGGNTGREARLSIMKDSHLGTFGVLAIMIFLLAKWVALEKLISSGSTICLLFILIISRDMMVELMTTLPYARSGEGMARPFVNGATSYQRGWTHTISLCFCLFFGPAGLALFVMGWIITRLFGASCRRFFGGITGDLLGATNEMVEVLLLMICAMPGKSILCYTGWGYLF